MVGSKMRRCVSRDEWGGHLFGSPVKHDKEDGLTHFIFFRGRVGLTSCFRQIGLLLNPTCTQARASHPSSLRSSDRATTQGGGVCLVIGSFW